MTLAEILKDSNYKLTQFTLTEQQKLEQRIKERTDSKGNQTNARGSYPAIVFTSIDG